MLKEIMLVYSWDFRLFCLSYRVIQSKNAAFPVGSHVVSSCGWRTHAISDGKDLTLLMFDWPKEVPMSLAVGAIGMPG